MNNFIIKTSKQEVIEKIQNHKVFTFEGIFTYKTIINAGDRVFIYLGGWQVAWESGLLGYGKIIKGPHSFYSQEGRQREYFKIDIEPLIILPKVISHEISTSAKWIENALSAVIARTRKWDFPGGKIPNISDPFYVLRDEIEEFVIRDPYLMENSRNREGFVSFLAALKKEELLPKEIVAIWKIENSQSFGQRDQETSANKKADLEKQLKKAGIKGLDILHKPQMAHGRKHFHDRKITARIMTADGEREYRWDISSGIDNLMNQSKEATIYLTETTG